MRWLLRDYHDDDLESVVRLCDATAAANCSPTASSTPGAAGCCPRCDDRCAGGLARPSSGRGDVQAVFFAVAINRLS